MKLNRKLATAAIALTATLAGIGATATAASAAGVRQEFYSQGNGVILDGSSGRGVTFTSLRSVYVDMKLKDATGDAYCTTAKATLYDSNNNQLGNTITIGSVCSGQNLPLPGKTISTQAGNIDHVKIVGTKGATGADQTSTNVYRSYTV